MGLTWLEITGIRNISNLRLRLNPGTNLIVGANGSGKTSILESIHLLGSARSFRRTSIDSLISKDLDQSIVRCELDKGSTRHLIGVQRTRAGSRVIKIDGDEVKRATDLASILPVMVLGADTVELLLGPPGIRRRFLNWGLFHVEQSFAQCWEGANRCLKQRNEVLKQNGSDEDLDTWTRELVHYSQQLDSIRNDYMEVYGRQFAICIERLTNLKEVTCHYYRGWGSEYSLSEYFLNDNEIDRKRRFTQKGFQRADVRIRVNNEDATSICSRGELKVLCWAMTLTQGALLEGSNDLVYLVDDMASELDNQHCKKIANYLLSTGEQIIATGIEADRQLSIWEGCNPQMFHVEHGRLMPDQNETH